MFMSGKNRSTMPGMPSQSRETICGLFSIILSIPSGSFLKYGYNSKWLDHSFHIETSTVTIWGMPSWPVDTMGYHGILLMIQQLRYSGVFFSENSRSARWRDGNGWKLEVLIDVFDTLTCSFKTQNLDVEDRNLQTSVAANMTIDMDPVFRIRVSHHWSIALKNFDQPFFLLPSVLGMKNIRTYHGSVGCHGWSWQIERAHTVYFA